jgi:hypothetical protein
MGFMSLLRAAWDAVSPANSPNNSNRREPAAVAEEATLRYTTSILKEARKETDPADSKESTLLAASGVGIGATFRISENWHRAGR